MNGQEIKAIFGNNIKLLRFQRQYSQADLAEKSNISITFLSNIERGLKFPKPSIMAQIAESLGVDVYTLFKSDLKPNDINIDNIELTYRISNDIYYKINNSIEKIFKKYLKKR